MKIELIENKLILTNEHPSSSYGLPVAVDIRNNKVFGKNDMILGRNGIEWRAGDVVSMIVSGWMQLDEVSVYDTETRKQLMEMYDFVGKFLN